jgi:type III secretory pathway component EscS
LYAQTNGIICLMLYQSLRFVLAFSVRPIIVADLIDLTVSLD